MKFWLKDIMLTKKKVDAKNFTLDDFWCSTKTDRFDNHINGQGNYGFCPQCDPICGTPCSDAPSAPFFGLGAAPEAPEAASFSSGDAPA